MLKLSNEEQETIIRWDRKNQEALAYTFEPTLKRKLEALAESYPEQVKLVAADNGSVEYTLPKKLISIRTPRKARTLSEEEKKNLATKLAQYRKEK